MNESQEQIPFLKASVRLFIFFFSNDRGVWMLLALSE